MDIDAINWLKSNLGIHNIFWGDIIKREYEIDLDREWDYIIFGDVIEHLENPGLALDNLKELMNRKTRLILTTPNVFSYPNLKTYITGKENVHPDHTFWPSYKTMKRLFKIKGLKIDYFTYCFYGDYGDISFKGRLFYKLIKNLRKTYIMPCLFFVLRRVS